MSPRKRPSRKPISPSSEAVQRLTDHLITGVICLDQALCVTYLNPACETLLELSASRALGQPIDQIMHLLPERTLQADLLRTLKTGQPYTRREAVLRVGLREKAIDLSVSLLPVTSTAPEQILLEIQPIDRLLRISREEAQVQQHQVARQLVRSVAHEVKNPLGGIRGATQLLLRKLRHHDDDLSEYTDVILSEVDRLRNLADTMLGSNLPPCFGHVNIHEPLERVRTLLLSEQPRLHIVRDYDLSLPELVGDRDQLIQVLLNIGRNAVQALTEQADSSQYPRLIFRTRVQRLFTIHGRLHRQVIRVDIEDNGPGIPPDFIESIFYPMVTGRAHGVGLGLAIAQDIIHRHEGLIECHSEPGRTIFSLFIPWQNPS